MRFSPMQSSFGINTCKQYGMPTDLSTGVLVDEEGVHRDSASILRILLCMGFPYTWMGRAALMLVPKFLRDGAYQAFARNRGAIWRLVKRITGMGDTKLEKYRDRIVGLEEPLDAGWGFESEEETTKTK